MAIETPSQRRLAEALKQLQDLQGRGLAVLRTGELQRRHREALLTAGFLRPVIKGWYMSSSPNERDGDTTSWYMHAVEFIGRYCDSRFNDQWCVSADYSVRLHAGDSNLPQQVVVNAPQGQNTPIQLRATHTLLDYRAKDFPPASEMTKIGHLRAMKLEHALARLPEAFYRTYARDAQIALMSLRDGSALSRVLIEGGHSVVAGRLVGALRACGRGEVADEVLRAMRGVGYAVTETNPFDAPPPQLRYMRNESPCVTRVRLMWQTLREHVIREVPAAPGLPADVEAYMAAVKDKYVRDAYNSLSIEGYRVTNELVERVASGNWKPDANEEDKQSRDALAARGYYLARQTVEASIREILAGLNPGRVASRGHREWYGKLFGPSVNAKIIRAADLAGYRGHQVYIRNATHVPPPVEAVREMMPALFELLEDEPSPAVRAVLGHFVFVFIHPYGDGNGRMGRFLMNTMLASGGYPWTVIELAHRDQYMAALDAASSGGDIVPFARFVAESMRREVKLAAAATTRAAEAPRRPRRPR